jgi:hypothetical protein
VKAAPQEKGQHGREEVSVMDKLVKAYEPPKLVQRYEPPVLLDLEQFVTVAGACSTGGGSCPGTN